MKRAALAAFLALFPLAASAANKTEPVTDLRPPRPVLPPPPITQRHDAWVLGAVGAGLILAALCWPRRKQPAPPPPRPFAVAHEKFAALRATGAQATPAAVAAIVRQYAGTAFGITGSGLTSEEIVSGLVTRRACPAEVTNAVWHFLSDCDRAEFSSLHESAESAVLVANASKLVDELEAARAKAARTI